jgi:hypothetical protein
VPGLFMFGLKEPEIDVWIGMLGPRVHCAKLSRTMSDVYRSGELDRYLVACEKMSGTPGELAAVLASDGTRYCRFIQAAGLLRAKQCPAASRRVAPNVARSVP